MSRNIPDVRPWRVRYWQGDKITQECVVNTITAHLARMLAREQLGWQAWANAERITVLSMRGPRHHYSSRF